MSESIVTVLGIPCGNGKDRHRIPALTFGVWCAHPGDGELWRVSHGPTGKALFRSCGDVDWWTAVRAAEEFHRTFGDTMPTREQAIAVYDAVIALSHEFIHSTDWLS